MVLVSRDYGSPLAIQDGIIYGLEQNAGYGQKIGIIVTQNISLSVNETGYSLLNTESLESIATALRISLGAEVDWIHFSLNANQQLTDYIVTDLLGVIVVSPGEQYQVNGRNILNALTNTIFEYWQSGPFTVQARALGTAITPITGPGIIEKIKEYLTPKYQSYVETGEADTTPAHATITYKGIPTGMQREDRFSPMNTFAFLPLSQEVTELEIALVAIAAIVARKPEGRNQLISLAKTYMDDVTKMLIAVINSGKTHPLTALNASTEFAVLAHRFGLITDSGYLKMSDQTRSIIDKLIQIDFAGIALDGLQTFVEAAPEIARAAMIPSLSKVP